MQKINNLFFSGQIFIRPQSSKMSGSIIYGILSLEYIKLIICNLIKNELLDLIAFFSVSERKRPVGIQFVFMEPKDYENSNRL